MQEIYWVVVLIVRWIVGFFDAVGSALCWYSVGWACGIATGATEGWTVSEGGLAVSEPFFVAYPAEFFTHKTGLVQMVSVVYF